MYGYGKQYNRQSFGEWSKANPLLSAIVLIGLGVVILIAAVTLTVSNKAQTNRLEHWEECTATIDDLKSHSHQHYIITGHYEQDGQTYYINITVRANYISRRELGDTITILVNPDNKREYTTVSESSSSASTHLFEVLGYALGAILVVIGCKMFRDNRNDFSLNV